MVCDHSPSCYNPVFCLIFFVCVVFSTLSACWFSSKSALLTLGAFARCICLAFAAVNIIVHRVWGLNPQPVPPRKFKVGSLWPSGCRYIQSFLEEVARATQHNIHTRCSKSQGERTKAKKITTRLKVYHRQQYSTHCSSVGRTKAGNYLSTSQYWHCSLSCASITLFLLFLSLRHSDVIVVCSLQYSTRAR